MSDIFPVVGFLYSAEKQSEILRAIFGHFDDCVSLHSMGSTATEAH